MATLTTVADIKTYLGVSGSGDDALLADLLDAAEDYIFQLCGRPSFEDAEYTHVFDGDGSDRLFLACTPIDLTADITVSIEGETEYDGLPTANSCPWRINAKTGEIRWKSSGGGLAGTFETVPPSDRRVYPYWIEGAGNISIVYTGGYSTIPAAVTQACIEAVKYLYLGRKRDTGLQSETLGSYSYTVGNGAGSAALLSNYDSLFRTLLAPYVKSGGLL